MLKLVTKFDPSFIQVLIRLCVIKLVVIGYAYHLSAAVLRHVRLRNSLTSSGPPLGSHRVCRGHYPSLLVLDLLLANLWKDIDHQAFFEVHTVGAFFDVGVVRDAISHNLAWGLLLVGIRRHMLSLFQKLQVGIGFTLIIGVLGVYILLSLLKDRLVQWSWWRFFSDLWVVWRNLRLILSIWDLDELAFEVWSLYDRWLQHKKPWLRAEEVFIQVLLLLIPNELAPFLIFRACIYVFELRLNQVGNHLFYLVLVHLHWMSTFMRGCCGRRGPTVLLARLKNHWLEVLQ